MDLFERIAAITKMASAIEDHVIYDQLGDLRIEAYGLKEEIIKLKEENQTLKQQLADSGTQTIDKDCYYFDGKGPYCTRCYDSDNKKILTHEYDNNMGTKYNQCPNCNVMVVKNTYHVDLGYVDEDPVRDILLYNP